jgi:hypothetical protein
VAISLMAVVYWWQGRMNGFEGDRNGTRRQPGAVLASKESTAEKHKSGN